MQLDELTQDWLGARQRASDKRGVRIAHRFFDILLSVVMLIMAAPLLTVAAIAIKLEGGGPVLFRQQRVGLHGQCFTLFKLRSMQADAEASGPVWAAEHDPRVTRVGSVLRRLRIDEVPQLINVLRNEMSLVGPRPERPYFVERLTAIIPFFTDRLLVKPGITGWAQVNYPYGASVEDARAKLAFDLFYVKHRSLWLDAVVLVATIRVVLLRDCSR